jgi:hypothetical protein
MPIQAGVHINKRSFSQVMVALKAGGEDAPGLKELRTAGTKAAKDLKAAQKKSILSAKTKGSRGGGARQRADLVTGGFSPFQRDVRKASKVGSLRAAIAGTLSSSVKSFKGGKAGPGRTGASISVRARSSKMPGGARGPLGRMPKHWNYGGWRHPVFAQKGAGRGTHTGTWVRQDVDRGWFDGTWAQRRERVQRELMKAAEQAYDFNKMQRRRGA